MAHFTLEIPFHKSQQFLAASKQLVEKTNLSAEHDSHACWKLDAYQLTDCAGGLTPSDVESRLIVFLANMGLTPEDYFLTNLEGQHHPEGHLQYSR